VGADAPRTLALASFDMTKAPEFGGANVPPGYSLAQTYVYPVTGATFSVYTNATANSTVVRLSDGRLVVVQCAFTEIHGMRVVTAESLLLWGAAERDAESFIRAVVLIDRMSAEVRWFLKPTRTLLFRSQTVVPDRAPYVLLAATQLDEQQPIATIYDLRNSSNVVRRTVNVSKWAALVGDAGFQVFDQTATQLLVGTSARAAIYNFVTNTLSPSYNGTQGSWGVTIGSAAIVDDNGTFVTCENNRRMVKSYAGAAVGAPVNVRCSGPLATSRGDVYTLSDVGDGPYTYYVARPDFALGEAAMIELPGRNFSSAVGIFFGPWLQATGSEQIAVVTIPETETGSGRFEPAYVAGVDLVAGSVLWVNDFAGEHPGAEAYGFAFQGTPLQAKGAENLLFTMYAVRYAAWSQDALLAVDIFTGAVKWRLPIQSGPSSVTLVGPLAAEPSPRVVVTKDNTTVTFAQTGLAAAASPAGFRPADTPVFPVTGAPVSTTAEPLPSGGFPSSGGGGKAGIVVACVLGGLGLVGSALLIGVFLVMRPRMRRQAQSGGGSGSGGGAYTAVSGVNTQSASRVLV
jgi:hypothetical protein